ncbi:RNA polymerase sigma factor [Maribellus maritimus]|uniref:RNA polymerase sigma factor n=1 Tax=Maribellus maritimus TaxID=2870838 RepID=UPI001EEC5CE0|nr:sigma-70 family RNA polymerase sigma factor [Maribellus maritimus]MCG6186826.1 sigma-70 family RNA polymerase sigma factor [Maribellus maritimus]
MKLEERNSDSRLWQDFLNGSKIAFQSIYFAHYRFLYNYCRKFTNDSALVEDIIQDLFVTLLVKRGSLSQTDNIRFYLFCSIRRKLFKTLNTKQYKVTDLFDNNNPKFLFEESVEPAYGDDEEQNRLRRKLLASVNRLGERQKEIVYLKYHSGLNSKEIAEVLGVSHQTVRNTLCNSLIKIRKDFEDEIPKGRMVVLFRSFFYEL